MDAVTGKLGMSYSVFKPAELKPLGRLSLQVFSLLRLVDVQVGVGEDNKYWQVSQNALKTDQEK